MAQLEEMKQIAAQVRRDIIRMVSAVQSGHPGGSLGCTEFMVALYFDVMKHNPSKFDMNGKGEDVFFLSNGHISPVWYSVLARSGYFPVDELNTFRKLDSRLQGHPTNAEHLEGVRIASGSLGQGLSVAAGMALGKKLDGDTNIVFSLHGDGELQEGQIWEAAMFASVHKLDNMIATVDYNGQQIDGSIHKIFPMGNLKHKWESFGWEVVEAEGNDLEKIREGLHQAKSLTGKGKPVVVIMHTEMGYGVDFMVGTHEWHGKAPNAEQTQRALNQLPVTLGDY